eukprot:m.96074 g.96074  ORF g.96074 m.96074 type:complete len:343 (+) comp16633_c0_seq2:227-1255(+)
MPPSRKRAHGDDVGDTTTIGIKKDAGKVGRECHSIWTEHVSAKTGKKYYHNRRTGVSTFKPPPEFLSSSDPVIPPTKATTSGAADVGGTKKHDETSTPSERHDAGKKDSRASTAEDARPSKRRDVSASPDDASKRRKVDADTDRYQGTTSKWLSNGFGFITPASGGEDLFCHSSCILDGECLVEGAKVTYERQFDSRKNKYRATNVRGGTTQAEAARIDARSSTSGGREHRLPLRQPYLKWIKEGRKTVEGRINSGCPAKMRAGDTVLFTGGRGGSESVRVTVDRVDSFDTFEAMLTNVGVELCLPDYKRIGDAVRLYRSFPGYAAKEQRFGVLAIHMVNAK